MSQHILQVKRIESLSSNQLADVLEFNGYGECVTLIRSRNINGEQFLKLTEVQISLWRLPVTQSRRLWSFIQQVKFDPKQLLIELPQDSKSQSKVLKKNNTISKSFVNNVNNNVTNVKSSSLTKEESLVFKNKLEGMFKKESDENPNKSFVHQQKHPKLPPKPLHLKQVGDGFLKIDEPDDTVEEYLEPIQGHFDIDNNPKNSSTFLNKYRRDSGQFLNKVEINPQDSKIKSIKDRPLPPLPSVKMFIPPAPSVVPDEESGDYTPVLDTEEEQIPEYIHVEDDIISVSKRPLPPIPVSDHEDLPEYTPVVEEVEEVATHVITQPAIFRRPPPPEPYFKSNSIKRNSTPLPTKFKTSSFKIKEQFSLEVQQKLKPPMKLPKPPIELPELPMPFLPSVKSNTVEEVEIVPQPDSSSDDESIDEDFLKNVPCYRETDRKGAKMLLTGLEDGAFIIRPSRQSKYVCTLSIMHAKKMFNIGIEQGDDGMIVFGSTAEDIKHPAFYRVKELVDYYMLYPLHLYGNYITLKNILPMNKR